MALKRIGCTVLALFAALLLIAGCATSTRGEPGDASSDAECDSAFNALDLPIGETNLSDGSRLTLQEYLDGNGDQSFVELRVSFTENESVMDGVVHTDSNGAVFMAPRPPSSSRTFTFRVSTDQYTRWFFNDPKITYLTLCMAR